MTNLSALTKEMMAADLEASILLQKVKPRHYITKNKSDFKSAGNGRKTVQRTENVSRVALTQLI